MGWLPKWLSRGLTPKEMRDSFEQIQYSLKLIAKTRDEIQKLYEKRISYEHIKNPIESIDRTLALIIKNNKKGILKLSIYSFARGISDMSKYAKKGQFRQFRWVLNNAIESCTRILSDLDNELNK